MTSKGLGELSVLPRDVRNRLYNFLTPWTDGFSTGLAIACTSRCIYEEFSDVTYSQCNMSFEINSARHLRPEGYEPNVTVKIEHCFTGKVFTQPLTDDLSYVLWDFPFHRIQSLSINIQAPSTDDIASLILIWKDIGYLIDHLTLMDLKSVNICPIGAWNISGISKTSLPSVCRIEHGGDFGLLLAPFGRLITEVHHPPSVFISAPIAFFSGLRTSWWFSSRSQLDEDSMTLTRHVTLQEVWRACSANPVIPDRDLQDMIDVELDGLLDEYHGETMDMLRKWRWVGWGGKYEENMIYGIRQLDPNTQLPAFKQLAERWAVWQGMQQLYADWEPSVDPAPEAWKNCMAMGGYSSKMSRARSLRSLFVDAVGNPRRGDDKWEEYKKCSSFYERPIEVTPYNIRWASLPLVEVGVGSCVLASTVLLRIDPPPSSEC